MSAPDSTPPKPASLALAGVVHDVNQLLTVITGRAGFLLGESVDPAWEPHLRAMVLASNDAAAILRRLSAATEAGPRPATTGLRAVAEQAKLLAWPVPAAGYQWCNEIEPEAVAAVPEQVLREVLTNLLFNALAVMPDGGRISVRADRAEAGRLQLRLADSGPGLPPGDPEQVFVRGVTSSEQPGRGIGLAGCRQLLAGVGGRLSAAQQEVGRGAVFVLDLPAGAVDTASSPVAVAAVPPMAVLVVDDESVVREMLGDVLASWGCQVQACRDGQTALAEYVPGAAAVALIDRNLPGLTGLELAVRLRQRDPQLSIVLMTGWQERETLGPVDPTIVDQEAEKPLAIARIQEILRAGYECHRARQIRGQEREV